MPSNIEVIDFPLFFFFGGGKKVGDFPKASCVEGLLSVFFSDSESGRCEVPDRLARIGDSQWSSSESWKILWFPAKGIKE